MFLFAFFWVCACWHFQVAGFFSTQPEICELQGNSLSYCCLGLRFPILFVFFPSLVIVCLFCFFCNVQGFKFSTTDFFFYKSKVIALLPLLQAFLSLKSQLKCHFWEAPSEPTLAPREPKLTRRDLHYPCT